MKKIIFFCLLLTGALTESHAQSFCGTPGNTPDFLQQIPSSAFTVPSSNYVLRVFTHIMRRSNGTGGQTQADVNTGLAIAAADFEAQGICLSLLGGDEIWNDTYYAYSFGSLVLDGNGDGKFDNFSPNSHANAIDIYLYPSDGNMAGGLTAHIVGTALVLGGNFNGINLVPSHVLAHELGHAAGLYHTFHGLCNGEGGCAELVNGSNCTTCGDFVCDTPPDPQVFEANANCTWNGVTCTGVNHDANGQAYNPAMNLIMAYVPPNCMTTFTNGQGTRMRSSIANSALLQGITVPNSLTISSLNVASGVTQLYDVLNDLTAQTSVTVQAGGSLTLQAGESVTLNPGFTANSSSTFAATIVNTCSTLGQNNSARHITPVSTASLSQELTTPTSGFTANVYPNPVSNLLSIDITAAASKSVEVKALSTAGVNLKTVKYAVAGKITQHFSFDVSGFAAGVYFIQISDGTQIITEKIIKAN